jgi:hypothetical protein
MRIFHSWSLDGYIGDFWVAIFGYGGESTDSLFRTALGRKLRPGKKTSLPTKLGGTVQDLVTFPTKRDEVSFRVVTEGASPSQVVNVQIPERSTLLAAPTVALQHHPTQHRIKPLRRSNSRSFL